MAEQEQGKWQEALRRIEEARKSGATNLNLIDLGLATIPEPLFHLTNLQVLALTRNQITAIPDSLAELANLEELDLRSNQINAIPDSLSRLANLQTLFLSNNRINDIPDSLSRLANLRTLHLSMNRITAIRDSFSRLANLRRLRLYSNLMTVIPDSLLRLAHLRNLDLSYNRITAIPDALSPLANLQSIDLSGNPLPDELLAAAKQGVQFLFRYLKSTAHAAHPRTVKLVLLGEPQSGKTTLLEALNGNPAPCDPDRKETLGVNVVTIDKAHPTDGRPIHLSTWDFAGQHMEHATHQFFLTKNAIFLILWNARQGAESGTRDLWYWLELLKMRVEEPKFLLVAMHTEHTPADLNVTGIQQSYSGYQGHFPVELDGLKGFAALEQKLVELAAASPALNAPWPPDWLPVRDKIRDIRKDQPHVTPAQFKKLMHDQGVSDPQQQQDLAEQLHQLGEILYFQQGTGLSNLVILSPAWLTELIARVVRSDQARQSRGVLCKADLEQVWRGAGTDAAELDSGVRNHLIRLMDQFDLTYSTVDAEDAEIVVEALPYSTPEELKQIELPADQPSMEMIFRFPELQRHLPPGIPTWGIARAHRLARPGLGPWRDAAFFEDLETASSAQILASDTLREVRLKVAADYPPFFFGQMEAILRDTFKRYKGLTPERRLPCPCQPGCSHSYNYEAVVKRRNSGKKEVSCDVSSDDVPIDSLLMGYSPKTRQGHLAQQSEQRRGFTTLMRAMNEQMEKTCPSVFTLVRSPNFKLLPSFWESFTSTEELELGLYCEHDSGWHPTSHSLYRFSPDKEWVEKLKKHWTPLVAVTLHVGPLAKAVGWAAEIAFFHVVGEAMESLHGGSHSSKSPLSRELGARDTPEPVDLTSREILKELIEHLDKKRPKQHHFGGLHRHIVEDGRLLWLCPDHLKTYQTR